MKSRLIHNPSAGMRTDYAAIESAAAVLRTAGWETEIRETQRSGDAIGLAREAAAEGFDVVFAVGGDGTVNEVVNGLVGSRTALGVLPYGTANVWAKEMGLPLGDMIEAARLQTKARIRCIDVGEVESEQIGRRAFVLWCGFGFDAAIAAEIEPQRAVRRLLGGSMWVLVGLRQAFTFRGRSAQILIDGKEHRMRLLLGLASNAQLYGGVVRVSPDAVLDDGLLDLALFRGTGALRTGWHLLRVFLGWHRTAPDVAQFKAHEISVRSGKLPIHVDAEPAGFTPVRITVRPQALSVLVPPGANKSLFSRIEKEG